MSDPNADTVDFVPTVGAAAPVGAMPNVSPVVRQMLDGLNRAIGVNNKTSCFWDRSGGAEFELLKIDPRQLTLENIAGRIGQFRADVSRPLYPVADPTLKYEVHGNDLRIDLSATLPGIVERFNPFAPHAVGASVGAPQPVGFGIMPIFSLFSLVWALFHMRVTMALPGNLAADIVLTDPNTLRADFVRGPKIHAVVGIALDIVPNYVIVTEHKAVVGFPGPIFGIQRTKEFTW